jgi:hypothetical protein
MAQTAQEIIQEAGVTTVCSKIFLAENPDYRPVRIRPRR